MSGWNWRSESWVAVDFDQQIIRGIAARRRGRVWKVEGWMEEPLIGSPAEALTALLKRLLGERERLVAVLPRSLFLERILTVPPVGARHLVNLVTEELDANLPWSSAERYDGWTLETPQGSRPGRMGSGPQRLVAMAGQRKTLQPFLEACGSGGIGFAGAVPAGVGLFNAALAAHGHPEFGRLLLVGSRCEVDLVAVKDGRWEFSRAFSRAETQEEVARSLSLLSPEDPTETSLWVPPDLDLPPAYWAAFGALLAASGEGALPLVVGGAGATSGRSTTASWIAGGLAVALVLAATGGVALQRIRERRALDRAAAAAAARETELAAWGTVAFPIALRLSQLETLAGALPPGTRLDSLRLERDRLAELRAGAPRASAVLASLAGAKGLADVALAGPAMRRPESSEESFALTGRLSAASTTPGSPPANSRRPDSALSDLHSFALAGLGSDQALTRLLLTVERAAAAARVRLDSKNAQVLTPTPGRERLGVEVSFVGDDRALVAFLSPLAERNPLLSLDFLTARRIGGSETTRGAVLVRLQLVLDRPATASTVAGGSPGKPASLTAAQMALPRPGAYPSLSAGQLFGLAQAQTPALAPVGRTSGEAVPTPLTPPRPVKSGLVLLGVVYDPVSPRALVRSAAGGSTVVVRPGDAVGQEKVVEIRSDGITVEVEGTAVRLPLPGQEAGRQGQQ